MKAQNAKAELTAKMKGAIHKASPMPNADLTMPEGHMGPGQPVDLTGPKTGFDQKIGSTVRTPSTAGGRYV